MIGGNKNRGNQKGIISEELIHRIDSIDEQVINNEELYKAQKKHTVKDSNLFNNNVYTEEMYIADEEDIIKNEKAKDFSILYGVLFVVIITIIIAIIYYIINSN